MLNLKIRIGEITVPRRRIRKDFIFQAVPEPGLNRMESCLDSLFRRHDICLGLAFLNNRHKGIPISHQAIDGILHMQCAAHLGINGIIVIAQQCQIRTVHISHELGRGISVNGKIHNAADSIRYKQISFRVILSEHRPQIRKHRKLRQQACLVLVNHLLSRFRLLIDQSRIGDKVRRYGNLQIVLHKPQIISQRNMGIQKGKEDADSSLQFIY